MKKISVEEIARYTYLSTTYVTKIYKEITGDTPINYLISLRMDKAKEILEEGHFRYWKWLSRWGMTTLITLVSSLKNATAVRLPTIKKRPVNK